jgi:hypothetical protein
MIAHSVAELLGNHVRLAVEGIDRMYLDVYVARLQSTNGAVSFFRVHRGQPLAFLRPDEPDEPAVCRGAGPFHRAA